MSGTSIDLSQEGALDKLPRSFVQALYHAVTGKTESLSSVLRGNVAVNINDIQRLYDMLHQRIEHYNPLVSPTVTVVVEDEDNHSFSHSSWEHFKLFNNHSVKITSEVTIKFEFLLQPPNTQAPQRCIINVLIDSGLPVVVRDGGPKDFDPWLISILNDWRTVKSKIEFVDFLIAKTFESTIEEWFKSLESVPKSRFVSFISLKMMSIRMASAHLGRIGAALFLAGYLYFNHGIGDTTKFAYAIALGLGLWGGLQIFMNMGMKAFSLHITNALLPTVILITEGDRRAYEKTCTRLKSSIWSGGGVLASVLGSIALNLLASYIAPKVF